MDIFSFLKQFSSLPKIQIFGKSLLYKVDIDIQAFFEHETLVLNVKGEVRFGPKRSRILGSSHIISSPNLQLKDYFLKVPGFGVDESFNTKFSDYSDPVALIYLLASGFDFSNHNQVVTFAGGRNVVVELVPNKEGFALWVKKVKRAQFKVCGESSKIELSRFGVELELRVKS